MNPRRVIGAVVFGLLLLLGLALRYIVGISHDEWDATWSLAYGLGMLVAMFMAFYDRSNFPEETWDFNPKRGVFYFLMGWIIFPFMMVVDAISGADFTLSGMLAGTFFLSVLIGIAGTFTENVGV